MTPFEKMVIRLLLAIWQTLQQAPGVTTYDEDVALEEEAKELVLNG